MNTTATSSLQQLRAYRADLFQRPAELREPNPAADSPEQAESIVDEGAEPRSPQDLGKGRLLDIYG
jgi:hypothetical protein